MESTAGKAVSPTRAKINLAVGKGEEELCGSAYWNKMKGGGEGGIRHAKLSDWVKKAISGGLSLRKLGRNYWGGREYVHRLILKTLD